MLATWVGLIWAGPICENFRFELKPEDHMGTLTLNYQVGFELGWLLENKYGRTSGLTHLLILMEMPPNKWKGSARVLN